LTYFAVARQFFLRDGPFEISVQPDARAVQRAGQEQFSFQARAFEAFFLKKKF